MNTKNVYTDTCAYTHTHKHKAN